MPYLNRSKLLMMKKIYFIIIAATILSSCSSIFKEPEIKVSQIKIEKITDSDIKGRLSVDIYNPNSISFEIKLGDCQIVVNNSLVGEFSKNKYQEIPAGKNQKTSIDITIPKSKLMSTLFTSFLGGKEISGVTIEGAIYIRKFFIPFKNNFSISHDFDFKKYLNR